MKKILDVSYPPITATMSTAPVLSVILHSEKAFPWFLLNNIQVSIQFEKYSHNVDFYNWLFHDYSCPYLDVKKIDKSFYKKYISMDIIDFFIDCINENCYIVVPIDMHYIPLYEDYYLHEHKHHPIFIYGYDLDLELFYVGDFFRGGKFAFEIATFEEICNAYNQNECNGFVNDINLLKRIDCDFIFIPPDFKSSFERYLHGIEPSAIYHPQGWYFEFFGLEHLYETLKHELLKFTLFQPFQFRAIPIFCDHKKVLFMTIDYLIRNGQNQLQHLLPKFIELYNLSTMYQNKLIKHLIKKENDKFNYKIFEEIKDKEISLLEDAIKLL